MALISRVVCLQLVLNTLVLVFRRIVFRFFCQNFSANKNFSFVIHVYSCMENLLKEVSEIKSEHDLFVKFLQLWIGLFADATFYWILAVEAIDGTWD